MQQGFLANNFSTMWCGLTSLQISKKAHSKRLKTKWQNLTSLKELRSIHSSPSEIIAAYANDLNRPPIKFSFKKLARMADGSCTATMGATSVLVTVVSKAASGLSPGFFPLTVDFRQKSAAAGRIPTNFLRRELGPTEREILTSRVIDRSLRPLFPKGYTSETQVVCNMLAVDGVNDPDVLSINAASAALVMSDIPWDGPVGAVRVGKALGSSDFIINPTRKELASSELNLIVTGTENLLTIMLEAEALNIDRHLFLDGVKVGLESCSKIASSLKSAADTFKVEKRQFKSSSLPQETVHSISKDMELLCEQKIRCIYMDTTHDKISRDKAAFAVRDRAISEIKSNYPGCDHHLFSDAFGMLCRKIVANLALHNQRRVDGRAFDQLRNINCEIDLYPPLHGSALFQRGQTQVLCTVALDTLESSLKSDTVSILMGGLKDRNFFLHYEFPQFAVNDIGKSSGAGRRELGHGALAEKALRAIVPKNFPFTIRLTSEVLESNGSSSMASVCGGTLALLDAGVPILSPAAGVAVGLVTQPSKDTLETTKHVVLLDIQGLEDYLGDMDFKIAGTRTGITALQADIKIAGLEFKVVEEAMNRGYFGICNILDIMGTCISMPKSGKSNWPVSEKLIVPINKRAKFLGPGGHNLKRLLLENGIHVTQHPEDADAWSIFAPNMDAMIEGKEAIEKILDNNRVPEFDFGAIYPATIVEILDHGVLVQLHPEMQPSLITNSQLDAKKILHPSALNLSVGQELLVKYYGRDPVSGSIRLSRKVLTMSAASAVKHLRKSTGSKTAPEIPDGDFVKSNRPKIREFYAVDDSPTRISSENVLPSMRENVAVNSKEDEEQSIMPSEFSSSNDVTSSYKEGDDVPTFTSLEGWSDSTSDQECPVESGVSVEINPKVRDEETIEEKDQFFDVSVESSGDVDKDTIFKKNSVSNKFCDKESTTLAKILKHKQNYFKRVANREQEFLLLEEKLKSRSHQHYYELDVHLQKVMSLNNDINETENRLKRINKDIKVTKKAYFILNSSQGDFITEAHLLEKFSQYMKLETKRRATEESLVNLKFSYKTAVETMLKAEEVFRSIEQNVKKMEPKGVDTSKVVTLLKRQHSFDSLSPGNYNAIVEQKSNHAITFQLENGKKFKLPLFKISTSEIQPDDLSAGIHCKIICSNPESTDDADCIYMVTPLNDSLWKDLDPEKFSFLAQRDAWRE